MNWWRVWSTAKAGSELLVQRMLRGGDGWLCTVAGLSDRDGRLRGPGDQAQS